MSDVQELYWKLAPFPQARLGTVLPLARCALRRVALYNREQWRASLEARQLGHGRCQCLVGEMSIMLAGNAGVGVTQQFADGEQVYRRLCQMRGVGGPRESTEIQKRLGFTHSLRGRRFTPPL